MKNITKIISISIFVLVGICMGIHGCAKEPVKKINEMPSLTPKNMPVWKGEYFKIKKIPSHDLWKYNRPRWI